MRVLILSDHLNEWLIDEVTEWLGEWLVNIHVVFIMETLSVRGKEYTELLDSLLKLIKELGDILLFALLYIDSFRSNHILALDVDHFFIW